MTFRLGSKSRAELTDVHPLLRAIVERAIALTEQDFGVHEGLRTVAQQREYVQRGVSTTMDSMHLRQPDGWGHAVDLVPYVSGVLRWEWPLIYPIAEAMRRAALEVAAGAVVRWGGVWDRRIGSLADGPDGLEDEVEAYVARRKAAGARRAFIDGPHYELRL